MTAKKIEDGTEAVVRYQGGSFWVWPLVDGFADFLTRLEELNPSVEVHGFSVARQQRRGVRRARAGRSE